MQNKTVVKTSKRIPRRERIVGQAWRLYSPQLGFWAALGGRFGFDIVPTTNPNEAQTFDSRDSRECKKKFYTIITGIAWQVQECTAETVGAVVTI